MFTITMQIVDMGIVYTVRQLHYWHVLEFIVDHNFCYLFSVMASNILLTGNVKLSSSVDEGRQFTCPGDLVTFTCQVFGSISLKWQFSQSGSITYTNTSTLSDVIRQGSFEANLTLVSSGDIATSPNITSTLRMTESMDAVSVQCLSTQDNETESFTVAGNNCYKYSLIQPTLIPKLNPPEHRNSH